MAVDLTTGSYDEAGVFSKYDEGPSKLTEKAKCDELCSLKNFRILRVLKECSHSKSVIVEGRFEGDERPAIIVVEKLPFDTRDLSQLLSSSTRLELKFRNNIYANYHVYPQNGFNGIGIQVIHPAKEDDFLKFVDQPLVMVKETKELYETVVCSYLKSSSHQNQESLNALKTSEKVIYSESTGNLHFVLLRDDPEKCSCTTPHIRAKAVILHPEILSLRDLTAASIAVLFRVRQKCMEELCTKYKIPASKLESYVYYPPLSFPLQVYFETVEKDNMIPVEKVHNFETIIANLQMIPDYYQKATLTYSIAESDPLLTKIGEHKNGYVFHA